MSEKVEIKKQYVLGAGAGLLLWYLMRQKPNETDIKVKEESKPVEITGNNNEVTRGVKIEDVSFIKINPNISVEKNFKNSEYFGKTPVAVPIEHYNNWRGMAMWLQRLRNKYGGAILIKSGYNVFGDGKRVEITPKDGNITKFWSSIHNLAMDNKYLGSDLLNAFSHISGNVVRFDFGVIKRILG